MCLRFGTRGRPNVKLEHGRLETEGLQRPAKFEPPIFFHSPQSGGEQRQDKKVNKALDREVNCILGRGTQF